MIYTILVVNFEVKLTLHDFNALFYLTRQNKRFLRGVCNFAVQENLHFRTEPNRTLVVVEPEQNRTRAMRVLSQLYSTVARQRVGWRCANSQFSRRSIGLDFVKHGKPVPIILLLPITGRLVTFCR